MTVTTAPRPAPPRPAPPRSAAPARARGRTALAAPARPLVVAHRGNSSVAPQNTLVAFECAARAGADLIELDLQLTRDGEAVVVHDDTVDATTDGTGRVDHLGATDLAALDAGAWFAEVYRGQRLPAVTDVLALLHRHPGVGLLAELKGAWTAAGVRRLASALTAAGPAGRVTVQSFHPGTVAALRDAAPELPRALLVDAEPAVADGRTTGAAGPAPGTTGLVDDTAGLVNLCRRLDVVACNPSDQLLRRRPHLVPELRAAGLRTMVWTLNDASQWRTALRTGVDGIITDRPDRLRGWLER